MFSENVSLSLSVNSSDMCYYFCSLHCDRTHSSVVMSPRSGSDLEVVITEDVWTVNKQSAVQSCCFYRIWRMRKKNKNWGWQWCFRCRLLEKLMEAESKYKYSIMTICFHIWLPHAKRKIMKQSVGTSTKAFFPRTEELEPSINLKGRNGQSCSSCSVH